MHGAAPQVHTFERVIFYTFEIESCLWLFSERRKKVQFHSAKVISATKRTGAESRVRHQKARTAPIDTISSNWKKYFPECRNGKDKNVDKLVISIILNHYQWIFDSFEAIKIMLKFIKNHKK